MDIFNKLKERKDMDITKDPDIKEKLLKILRGEFLAVSDNNSGWGGITFTTSNIVKVVYFVLQNLDTLEKLIRDYDLATEKLKESIAEDLSDSDLIKLGLEGYSKDE